MDNSLLCDYDYFDTLRKIDRLSQRYPFAGRRQIGKSVMGKGIEALVLGAAEEYAVFIGGIHGRDNFSVGLVLTFFEELCEALTQSGSIEGLNVARAMTGRAIIVIPCLNPDGCEIASVGKSGCPHRLLEKMSPAQDLKDFSLNARGVDVDLNFSLERQPSEPESFALAKLFKETRVRQAVIFGSGNNEIISPGGAKVPARSNRMTEIMTASTGYTVSSNRNDRRREGFIDWFTGEYFRPAYKILPKIPIEGMTESDYIRIYRELRELMMLCAIM